MKILLAVSILLFTASAALAGTVYGDVAIATRQPQQIKLSFVDDAGHATSVTTDAKGHYEVSLPPGRYRIESDAGAVSPATIEVFHEPRQQRLTVADVK